MEVPFDTLNDVLWHKQEVLPGHPNGLRFTLTRKDGSTYSDTFYSTGGGFIYSEAELAQNTNVVSTLAVSLPYPSPPWQNFWSMANAQA